MLEGSSVIGGRNGKAGGDNDLNTDVRVDGRRLLDRLEELAEIGPIDGGGSCRLALTDDDRLGRDLLVTWMKDLGLTVTIDVVGNITGTWEVGAGAPVMTGSHIDTVRTGGRYDGNLGVLAGLEVIESLMAAGVRPRRPIAVTVFSNEEGARFQPDMLGSLVYVGGLGVEQALSTLAIDGPSYGDELGRIGYAGTVPCPGPAPYAFVELHIEQGPVLEREGFRFGAVTGVQGISWQEVTIEGQSNHAGTTPMSMRRDPALVAARLTVFLRELAERMGGDQVCTVGRIEVVPNLINVVPRSATLTLDVRNTDEKLLKAAEAEIDGFIEQIAADENVTISRRQLARFEPVEFDPRVVDSVERAITGRGHSVRRLPSGAGHDAQMLARVCPTAMIFTPSHLGISHNPAEHTDDADLVEGTQLLLDVMLDLLDTEFTPSSVESPTRSLT
ncbi:MAG: Zn-dependent hydrolase [Actinomycetota bacterium]|nr:Zn-dependent hydrolase [Actinomycetota bacterium]MDA3010921.1 Zn-dependent hydrolase [Actinomycetota bacterium]MDA3023857.1 Zn-dependent hydrolase [Actinomycetota bacterium]